MVVAAYGERIVRAGSNGRSCVWREDCEGW